MFRQSPNRTQRSRGIKVKHVLQICFLVAICFWLLYQVKHSHDKKKELDESDVKVSQQTQSSSDNLKLGRKDLNPRVEDTTSIRSQDEETEEENAGEEEEIKLDEENAEDKNSEEKGDEQGVGDDEVDEHEEDKSDAEVDREEDVIEEEKESEERDSEDHDGIQMDNESSVEEHDDDEQAHEAREEHYKADDASSAVTHETEAVGTENGNGNMKRSDDSAGTNLFGNEQVVNNTSENSVGDQTTVSKAEDRKMTEEGDLIKTTDNKDLESVGSKSDDGSNDHLQLVNNTTEAGSATLNLSMRNGTEQESESSHAENVTTKGTTSGDGSNLLTIVPGLNSSLSSTENQADSNLTTSTKVDNADLNSREVLETDNSTLSTPPQQLVKSSNETEDNSSTADNNNAAVETNQEDSSNDGTDGASENALETENPDEIQHDFIDSSDSAISLGEKEVRNDLETLPEILTEGGNDDEAAAE